MSLPSDVTMREVGARDGIQSLGIAIPTEVKIELIERIVAAGVRRIEATSFVHPKYVPQMADAEQVMQALRRVPGVSYEALVPNVRGAERAIATGVDRIELVVTASETFNQKNVRMSIAESFAQFADIMRLALDAKVPVNFGIGNVFGCPYEGDVPESRIFDLMRQSLDLGASEISLADTTGMGNPIQVERLATEALRIAGDVPIRLHFHNTRGMGLANVVAGLRAGVTTFDGSIGGLGGCPFAPRATGNVCSEDTVHMLHELGIRTGIDLPALIECARFAAQALDMELPGQVMKAGPRSQLSPA